MNKDKNDCRPRMIRVGAGCALRAQSAGSRSHEDINVTVCVSPKTTNITPHTRPRTGTRGSPAQNPVVDTGRYLLRQTHVVCGLIVVSAL